jgi:hypothetical protein
VADRRGARKERVVSVTCCVDCGVRLGLDVGAVEYGTGFDTDVDGSTEELMVARFWGFPTWNGKWVVPSCTYIGNQEARWSVVLPGQHEYVLDKRTISLTLLNVGRFPAAVFPSQGGPISGRGRVPAGRSAAIRMVSSVSSNRSLLVCLLFMNEDDTF